MAITAFYQKQTDAAEIREVLKPAILAFYRLVTKLQQDEFIKPLTNISFSEELLKELALFSVALFYEKCEENLQTDKRLLYLLIADLNEAVFSMEAGEFEAGAESYRRRIAQEDLTEILQGFGVLCRFDQMAQEYSGAFYERMKVENPGRLVPFYLQVFEAYGKMLRAYYNYHESLSKKKDAMIQNISLIWKVTEEELSKNQLEALE